MKLADGVTFYPHGRTLETEGGQLGLIFFQKSWSGLVRALEGGREQPVGGVAPERESGSCYR